jgi:hypothetical protein
MIRQLINLGKRGRELSAEGSWEGVPEDVHGKARSLESRQRTSEQIEAESRKLSEWDRQLDQGRMKKVKGKKDNSAFFQDRNLFQEKLDSQNSKRRNDSSI